MATQGGKFVARLARGLAEAASSPAVAGIIVVSALVLALGGGLEEFWPVFGAQVGLARPLIALFVGLQQALEAGASLAAHRLNRVRRGWLGGLLCLAGAMLAAAALIYRAPAMALLAAYSGLMRLIDVSLEGRLQRRIGSDSRATVGSVKGFASRIGVVAVYLLLGPLAQATSYRLGFLACGVAGLLLGAVLIWRRATRPLSDPRRTA